MSDKKKDLICSFCGKPKQEVKKLIAGSGVYICDKCVASCTEILKKELAGDNIEDGCQMVPESIFPLPPG